MIVKGQDTLGFIWFNHPMGSQWWGPLHQQIIHFKIGQNLAKVGIRNPSRSKTGGWKERYPLVWCVNGYGKISELSLHSLWSHNSPRHILSNLKRHQRTWHHGFLHYPCLKHALKKYTQNSPPWRDLGRDWTLYQAAISALGVYRWQGERKVNHQSMVV